jgi:hypothetical protein
MMMPTYQQQEHSSPASAARLVARGVSRRSARALASTMATLALSEREVVALELAADEHGISFQVRASTPEGLAHLTSQLQALYPQTRMAQLSAGEDPLRLERDEAVTVVELAVRGHPYLSLATPTHPVWQNSRSPQAAIVGDDPLLVVVGALQAVPPGMRALAQLALVPAPAQWSRPWRRKAVEHPLEPERKRQDGGPPSMGRIVALALLVMFALLWRRAKPSLLPLVPGWVRQDGVQLVHGHLPVLSSFQMMQLAAVLGLLFFVVFVASRLWNRLQGRPAIYDQRAVGEKTKQVAYRARLRLLVIGKVEPLPSWGGKKRAGHPLRGSRRGAWMGGGLWQWARTRWQQRQQRRQVAMRLAAAYRQYDNPAGNVLVPQVCHAHLLVRPSVRRWSRGVSHSPLYLSVEEVAVLWHLITEQDAPDIAGLERGLARSRPLPLRLANALPTTEVLPYQLGRCEHAGHVWPIFAPRDLFHHNSLAVAATGKGKSTLFSHLALAHLTVTGQEGLFFMEPHGDGIAALLGSIPPHRRDDVTLIDLADPTMVVGLNPLDMTQGRGRDKTVDDLLAVFIAFWQKQRSWGPRTENILQFALLALAEANLRRLERDGELGAEQQYTLLDVIPLLQKPGFRRAVLADVRDPVVLDWFHHYYDPLRQSFREEMISSIINKISKYAAARVSRRLLGQSRATVRLADDIRSGRALLVNTASGIVGEEVSALVGATLVGLFQAALAEQIRLPPQQRRRFWVVIDEFQTYLGIDYNTMLAELRKYGGSFALATQSLSYLDEVDRALKPTVLANIDHLFCFAMEAADARTLAPYLDGLEAADLVNLDAYTCYARWTIQGQRLPAFSLQIAPLPHPTEAVATAIRQHSNERHTRPAALVDEEVSPEPLQPLSRTDNAALWPDDDEQESAGKTVGSTNEKGDEAARKRGGRGKGRTERGAGQEPGEQGAHRSPSDGEPLSQPYVLTHPRVRWHPEDAADNESGELKGE